MTQPETILQFGAGRFLRAFFDRFVHQANESGQNVGRIVVVQRAADQRSELLNSQPDGYRVLVRGYQDGELVNRNENVQSISRVLTSDRQWREVLTFAKSPDLRFIVSNATESGYVLDPKDKITKSPETLPAKLTQVLWARYQAKAGPVTMLPCELIEANADRLKDLMLTQSKTWDLPSDFQKWLSEECIWLNSLVDCIVTMPEPALAKDDPLLICAEPYYLWALPHQARSASGRSTSICSTIRPCVWPTMSLPISCERCASSTAPTRRWSASSSVNSRQCSTFLRTRPPPAGYVI